MVENFLKNTGIDFIFDLILLSYSQQKDEPTWLAHVSEGQIFRLYISNSLAFFDVPKLRVS